MMPLYFGTKRAWIQKNTPLAPFERAGDAMALLLGGCDNLVVKLDGRWHSDSMMVYLHQATLPLYKQLSSEILPMAAIVFLQTHLLLFINFCSPNKLTYPTLTSFFDSHPFDLPLSVC